MSDSIFHAILYLLNYLHFGSNTQNQEITGKHHQIDLCWEKKYDDVFFDKMSKVASSCFICKIITTSLLFDPVLDKKWIYTDWVQK